MWGQWDTLCGRNHDSATDLVLQLQLVALGGLGSLVRASVCWFVCLLFLFFLNQALYSLVSETFGHASVTHF